MSHKKNQLVAHTKEPSGFWTMKPADRPYNGTSWHETSKKPSGLRTKESAGYSYNGSVWFDNKRTSWSPIQRNQLVFITREPVGNHVIKYYSYKSSILRPFNIQSCIAYTFGCIAYTFGDERCISTLEVGICRSKSKTWTLVRIKVA